MQTADIHLKYVIIDDEEIDRTAVELEAGKFHFLQKIGSYSNLVEALEIISHSSPDVIFLDIEMPVISGMDFLRKENHPTFLPVLITSHPEFALEGFELEAFDYLLKPVSSERFSTCALRLLDFYQMHSKACAFDIEQENNFIMIKQGYDKYKIAINDILYVEAMKDYTKIVTTDHRYLVLSTLNGIIEKLPADKFVRIHRSYVVNKNKVEVFQKDNIKIQSTVLPIGKLYKHELNS